MPLNPLTERQLRARHLILTCVREGISRSHIEAYWFLVDAGSMPESDTVKRWAITEDERVPK
jgi:hypothetical protein